MQPKPAVDAGSVFEDAQDIVLLVGALDCEPCEQLATAIARYPSTVYLVRKQVFNLKSREDCALLRRLGISQFPTTVIMKSGREAARFFGANLDGPPDEIANAYYQKIEMTLAGSLVASANVESS